MGSTKPTPLSIMIYLPDCLDLREYLTPFYDMGFEDWDWCELRNDDNARITYGPCEPLSDGN